MEDEIVGTQGQSALDFSAEGDDGFLADLARLAAEIDEIAGVDRHRSAVIFDAELLKLLGVRRIDARGAPHARA